MHQIYLPFHLKKLLDFALGKPIKLYVDPELDLCVCGILLDFDDKYVYLQDETSVCAWKIEFFAGILVETAPKAPALET